MAHKRTSNQRKGPRNPLCFDENLGREEAKIPRRSFLKKAISTLGSIALAGWIGAGIGCKSPNGPEPPEVIGNLRGKVVGLLKEGLITEGTVTLGRIDQKGYVSLSDYTSSIKGDGTFEILNIKKPSDYKRIQLRSSQAIKRETNITLQAGDNNAEINMIEADNISGYEYQDYITVNKLGFKMSSQKQYKAYFYDKTVWEWDDTNQKWNNVGTATDMYCEDARQKINDVLQNDLTVMSDNNYTYGGLLLESQGAEGPGLPIATDKKEGWLIIYLRQNQEAALLTGASQSNYIITGAEMSIRYYPSAVRIIIPRGGYSQDICEWAGYIDLIQKSNYSIFADSDHGFVITSYPSPFDKEYAKVIKYSRLPGHYNKDDILDYDPPGSTGSGIYITYTRSLAPVSPHSPFDNPFFQSPGLDDRLSHREMSREHEQRIGEKKVKKR